MKNFPFYKYMTLIYLSVLPKLHFFSIIPNLDHLKYKFLAPPGSQTLPPLQAPTLKAKRAIKMTVRYNKKTNPVRVSWQSILPMVTF